MKFSKLIERDRVEELLSTGFINIRLSQLGRCHRAIQYGSFGIKQEEPSENTRRMWKDRVEDESNIIKELKKKYRIKYHGSYQKTYYRRVMDTKHIFSCTPDGLIEYKGEWIPLEIKSLNPFRFQIINAPEKLSREHYVQIQGEILLTMSDKALLVIGNSKTKDEFKKILVPKDERIDSWIERRILFIFKKGKWIYPEFLPGSKECRYCLYKEKCKKDIYKIPQIDYNLSLKIDSDDFDFKGADEAIRGIKTKKLEIEDLKIELLRNLYVVRDLMIKRKASEFKVGRIKIQSSEIDSLMEGIKDEHN